ncbi:MAG: hypothetical protein BWX67_01598 [Thermotogae bacterium ADurb.Bin062]|jgi:hypothetical protein|nr:MAG: hypothetical protein BWX67_01598 [Thermotogota bacterium ADurb.Bin062]
MRVADIIQYEGENKPFLEELSRLVAERNAKCRYLK